MGTGSTFRAGSNTLKFANYFASGTGEDNAGAEMTEVSTSGFEILILRSILNVLSTEQSIIQLYNYHCQNLLVDYSLWHLSSLQLVPV